MNLLSIDTALFRLLNNGWVAVWMDQVMRAVTSIGHVAWVFLVAALTLAILGGAKTRRSVGLMGITVLITDFVVSRFLKPWAARPRPFQTLAHVRLVIPDQHLSTFSFPSNHAANIAAAVALLYFLYPRKWLGGAGVALVLLVDYSRIYIGVHYPSDVLAGNGVGLALGYAAFVLWKRMREPDVEPEMK